MGIGGQRTVGVTGHADDASRGLVDAHAHAALGGAAQAGGVTDLLRGIGLQLAVRAHREFGRGGVAPDIVAGRILAHHLVADAAQSLRKAGGKGGQATSGDQLTTRTSFHDAFLALRRFWLSGS